MQFNFKLYLLILLTPILFIADSPVFAEDITPHQINLNIIDRLARIEEGQKAIITEMRTRFKAVDERFEAVDRRFESILREMTQRFEAVDKRFEAVDKRLDSMDKRLDSMEKRIDYFGNFNIAIIAALIALIGYIIWDRKTAFEKAFTKAQKELEKLVNEFFINKRPDKYQEKDSSITIPEQNYQKLDIQTIRDNQDSIQEKLNQVITVMAQMSKQSPEMQKIMNTAQLA